MTGIILAAGRGGRLRDVAGQKPKCLVPLGACTLLERQLRALAACGVDRPVVVTGYRSADVRRVAGSRVTFVHNERFASTNSLYSLWLARHFVADSCVILNGDVLFHPQLLDELLNAGCEDALLMAPRTAPYTDEEMKVRVKAGCVDEIAKDLAEADGENVGIVKFGADGARVLVEEANRLIASGETMAWLPAAFAAFARRRPLHVVSTRDYPWIEIDFPEDYWRACREVLPAIDDDGRPGRELTAAATRSSRCHV